MGKFAKSKSALKVGSKVYMKSEVKWQEQVFTRQPYLVRR